MNKNLSRKENREFETISKYFTQIAVYQKVKKRKVKKSNDLHANNLFFEMHLRGNSKL